MGGVRVTEEYSSSDGVRDGGHTRPGETSEDNEREVQALIDLISTSNGACGVQTFMKLAVLYRSRGEYCRSQEILDCASRNYPGNAAVHIEQAVLYMHLGAWSDARASWEKSARDDVRHLSALNISRYAKCLEMLGDWLCHERVIATGLQLYPDDKALIFRRKFSEAVIRGLAGDYEGSRKAESELSSMEPLSMWPPRTATIQTSPDKTYLHLAVQVIEGAHDEHFAKFRSRIPEKRWSDTKILFAWVRAVLSRRVDGQGRAAMRVLRTLATSPAIATELRANLNWITTPTDLDPLEKLMILAEVADRSVWVRYGLALVEAARVAADLETLRRLHAPHRNIVARRSGAATAALKSFGGGFSQIGRAAAEASAGLEPPSVLRTKVAPNRGRLRVVFVAAVLPAIETSTHLNTVYHVLHTLKDSGHAVDFYLALSGEDSVNTPWGPMGVFSEAQASFHKDRWAELGADPARYFNGCVAASVDTNVTRDFLSWITSVDPDLVVFVGDLFESQIYRRYIYWRYPTAYLPMSVTNDPNGQADGVFSHSDRHCRRMESKYGSSAVGRVRFPVRVFQDDSPYLGKSYRRSPDDVIFATPLHNNRIEKVIASWSQEDFDAIIEVFSKSERFVWVLVGKCDFAKVLARWPRMVPIAKSGRLVQADFISQLRGFFRTIDGVFVMPKMTGGNQGVCAAMHEGLPAVGSSECDSAGIIPADLTYSTPQECSRILLNLAHDDEFRSQKAREARRVALELTPESVGAEWVEVLYRFSEQGKQRLRGLS